MICVRYAAGTLLEQRLGLLASSDTVAVRADALRVLAAGSEPSAGRVPSTASISRQRGQRVVRLGASTRSRVERLRPAPEGGRRRRQRHRRAGACSAR